MGIYDATKLERLNQVYEAARKLKFGSYPAHGAGFIIRVIDGDISELQAAIESVEGLSLVREQT